MASDAVKYTPINGGGAATSSPTAEIKSLFSSFIKTRKRTTTFAYAFMFVFVCFTVFLAFSPSPNSSSPWFSNIFSITTTTGNGRTGGSSAADSYGSRFPSVFSYFFPNSSSQQQESSSTIRSNNDTVSPSPAAGKAYPDAKNGTFQPPASTNNTKIEDPVAKNDTSRAPATEKSNPLSKNSTVGSPPPANPISKNTTSQSVVTDNKVSNGSKNQSEKSNVNKDLKKANQTEIAASPPSSNLTASLSTKKKQSSNETEDNSKQAIDNWLQSLKNCDFFDGKWVRDESYPLYKPGSCQLIDEQFNCILNGRPDKDFQKLKWKPKGCTLPRLNGAHLLEMIRGKRLVFVGDSLNRNMWESLVCVLRGSVKDEKNVYEANGRHHFRGEAEYSFVFKDYNCTVEFFVSPFLVQEWEVVDKNGTKKETLRLDLVGKSSEQYKGADIIVFNTGHWWTHDKTAKGQDYYQEGSHVYSELNVLEAFRKAITTWGRWVDANVNPAKSLVFFRGYSASHFSGGQWNSGGACDSETEPIKNETYLTPYPSKMQVLERVLKGMKTQVTYLNITRLTDYRKDGHPSIYRKQHLTDEERRSPLLYQDCSHWCLPGVPDSWNEILYAELLVKLNQERLNKERQTQRRT